MNKKLVATTNERVFSLQYDMAVYWILGFVIIIIMTAINKEFAIIPKNISNNLEYIILIWVVLSLVVPQPLCLLLFKNSLGTKKYKIRFKNMDGTEPSRLKFLFQLIINIIIGGICFLLYLKIKYGGVLIFIVILIVMNILSKKGDRTLVDHILKIQAVKEEEVK